jgi:hypothetical protein
MPIDSLRFSIGITGLVRFPGRFVLWAHMAALNAKSARAVDADEGTRQG